MVVVRAAPLVRLVPFITRRRVLPVRLVIMQVPLDWHTASIVELANTLLLLVPSTHPSARTVSLGHTLQPPPPAACCVLLENTCLPVVWLGVRAVRSARIYRVVVPRLLVFSAGTGQLVSVLLGTVHVEIVRLVIMFRAVGCIYALLALQAPFRLELE